MVGTAPLAMAPNHIKPPKHNAVMGRNKPHNARSSSSGFLLPYTTAPHWAPHYTGVWVLGGGTVFPRGIGIRCQWEVSAWALPSAGSA